MNCILYARVSTEKQAEKELSIPFQIKVMREYAKRNGFKVIGEFIEQGKSAKTINRPELKRLLDYCKEHKDVNVVLIHKIDRLARKIISREAILCAVGITESGEKEFLGFLPGGRESRQAWEQFLTHLVRRGLDSRAVKLVISDGCPGMIRAIRTIFPYSDHQHCLFHKMFNLRAKCPRSEWPLIKAKILKITIILKNLLNLIFHWLKI